MTTFQITNGPEIYDFDMAGGVSIAGVNGGAGVNVGSWTTNATNQIVLAAANPAVFDVLWAFNDRNQLTIQPQNAAIFNFATAGLRNSFSTFNGVLRVQPDRLGAFAFELCGDWNLDQDHNLIFTASGVPSTLDGFVSDPLGRFIYHFANKDNVLETNVLGFTGWWQTKSDATGTPLLDFYYQTPTGDAIFELPQPISINRGSNQLTYVYSKGNQTPSIDFQGALTIGPDFTVTYVLQNQVSSSGAEMAASTTLAFGAMITQPNLHGDLLLTVVKPDGTAGNSTLTIGGEYQGVLGKANLQAGFTFTQTFGVGNQITRTAAFGGSLAFNSGAIQWTFSATGTSIDLAVGVDIKLGPIQIDARLNLPVDGGQTAGVTYLLGVSF
jgi:hypothetical protein